VQRVLAMCNSPTMIFGLRVAGIICFTDVWN
jgi:hypothetical protein